MHSWLKTHSLYLKWQSLSKNYSQTWLHTSLNRPTIRSFCLTFFMCAFFLSHFNVVEYLLRLSRMSIYNIKMKLNASQSKQNVFNFSTTFTFATFTTIFIYFFNALAVEIEKEKKKKIIIGFRFQKLQK